MRPSFRIRHRKPRDLFHESVLSIHVRLSVIATLFAQLALEAAEPLTPLGVLSHEVTKGKVLPQGVVASLTDIQMMSWPQVSVAVADRVERFPSGNPEVTPVCIADIAKTFYDGWQRSVLNDNVNVNDRLGRHAGYCGAADMLNRVRNSLELVFDSSPELAEP